MKNKRQPERQIHKAVMEFLAFYSGYFTFFTYDRKGGYSPTRGTFMKVPRAGERTDIKPLDIVGWEHRTGKIIWIEVKRPEPNKTYPDKQQKAMIEHVNKTGGISLVIRSLQDAKQFVEQLITESKKQEFFNLYNNKKEIA